MFLEFPEGCVDFMNNNPKKCFVELWHQIGCTDEGYGNPKSFGSEEIESYNGITLRYIVLFTQQNLVWQKTDHRSL